jgi:quercetin dioxygenase-like cupin family protein
LTGGPPVEHVKVARVELAPGQEAGRHLHPCPVVGCILSGAIRFQVADEPETRLQAGDAFFEPAGVEVPHFDNASSTEPAVFLACYLLPPGEERLIEMLP